MRAFLERSATVIVVVAFILLLMSATLVEGRMARFLLAAVTGSVALWTAASARPAQGTRPPGVERRRYLALRSRTEEFLRDIRLMNAVAVAANEGSRPREEAEDELGRIEQRLHILVPELRRAAGLAA